MIENIPCFLILLPALKSLKGLFRLNAPQSMQASGKGIYRRILKKESFKYAFFGGSRSTTKIHGLDQALYYCKVNMHKAKRDCKTDILSAVKPLMTNTSEEFIKCPLDNFSMSFILYYVNFSICENK